MRQQLSGNGPFILRTSEGKAFTIPNSESVLLGQHNVVIEDPKGLLEIIDPSDVVSIHPTFRRRPGKTGRK